MLIDEVTINDATVDDLLKAKAELDMYSVKTDKEYQILNIINTRLSNKKDQILWVKNL